MSSPALLRSLPVTIAFALVAADAAGAADEAVRVAASERYEAGRVHRFAFGGGYRDLWAVPIELPLLDLSHEGGGLTPTRRFGGLQTAVLGFRGEDGRLYTFRGTDKDPSAVLDPLLRETLVRAIVQDQMAAQHPGGPLAAGVVAREAGVLAVDERMVVMPDDPRLGEFRAEFAGMVGSFFEYPQPGEDGRPGFAGASEIIDHDALYERLARGGDDRVNVEAFVRARLLDLLLGDFDRHRKQWRWARLPGSELWQPIPEDRDMAFVRFDGFGQRLASVYIPILQSYGPTYPSMRGLALHGWEQDRWLLPALSWETWERVAADMQARLSDAVLTRAVAALPPEYAERDGDRLRRDLRGRVDRLPEAARALYEHLAGEVDIQTSDAADDVQIEHAENGSVLVTVRAFASATATSAPAPARFRRRFEACETKEVRLYLRAGDDRIRVTGPKSGVQVRVIADGGRKRLSESECSATRVYDERGAVDVSEAPCAVVDSRPYVPPRSDAGFVDVEEVPPRDWGSEWLPIPQVGFENDVGAFLGVGVIHTRYGFRKHPWSSRHSLSAGWATEDNRPRVRYVGAFRPENSPWIAKLDVKVSGIEVLRFYGFGNETSDRGSDRLFRVRNENYRIVPSVEVPILEERGALWAGPYLEYSRTRRNNRLIDILDPYGAGRFGAIGLEGGFRYDTRRSIEGENPSLTLPFHANPAAGFPTSGIVFDASARVSPPVWDVEQTWGSLKGTLAGFYTPFESGRAVVGLRVGGETNFGREPYFNSAYIGGGRTFSGDATIRGYRAQRFRRRQCRLRESRSSHRALPHQAALPRRFRHPRLRRRRPRLRERREFGPLAWEWRRRRLVRAPRPHQHDQPLGLGQPRRDPLLSALRLPLLGPPGQAASSSASRSSAAAR